MNTRRYALFQGSKRVSVGTSEEIRKVLGELTMKGVDERVSIYDQSTGKVSELTEEDAPTKKAGRPKLGVVCKEVSLLPRHWGWLSAQRGGASATIRRLVDEARKTNAGEDSIRKAVNKVHAFLWDLAGDQVGFEEASRALFAHNFESFRELISGWPKDIQLQAIEFLEDT